MKIKAWLKKIRCSHSRTAVHTFIENEIAPLVRRQAVCLDCGENAGWLPPMDGKVVEDLLAQATALPKGQSLEI